MPECHSLALYRTDRGILNIIPEPDNMRVSTAPAIDDTRKFLLRNTAFQRAHAFQRTDTALIAAGQRSDFAFRTEIRVRTAFFFISFLTLWNIIAAVAS